MASDTRNKSPVQSSTSTQPQISNTPVLTLNLTANESNNTEPRVRWDSTVIDNEFLNKKKSKGKF